MEHKIHVGYGFHVNCYHSYRGDTNDGMGFGSDIRIIRKILDTLTALNEEGIPVKGTWDCENFFSLEKILPEYAPDIITKMRDRTECYGDEQIIMGYSNGALGAMNEAELTASIEKAVTNEAGSGLKDLFGSCEMIVRPQEMMFTPSQTAVYNKLGVKALCLYYSCVPFDAFRTLISPLPDELAFNPLTYTYKNDSITVIPTYSNPDVCDAGCLRAWVRELHEKQEKGEINSDLFIFINMDADAVFWESLNLPVAGNRIANTDGINGLVREIADLDYIVFDTPGGYLNNHKPLGNIDFTHDTADGNFTGFASWSEKPYNRKIWTAIERSRALSKVNAKNDSECPSFDDRVLLLSTTHFGLATPVLNIQREKKADELAEKIVNEELSALKIPKEITVHNINGTRLQCLQVKLNGDIEDISALKLSAPDLQSFTAVRTANNGAFLMMKFKTVKKKYTVTVSTGDTVKPEATQILRSKSTEMLFSCYGNVYSVYCKNKKIGGSDFLESFISYDGNKYAFEKCLTTPLSVAGSGKGIRISGEIHLPDEIEGGSYILDFFTSDTADGIFIQSEINYPRTKEETSISTENSALGRYSDMKWQEAAPLQITPCLDGDIKVIKRNFDGDISSYRAAAIPESDPENRKLDSFNHHMTAGLVGLSGSEATVIIANSRQMLSSMAHCPMRLDEDGTVHMNMFGTYFGKQRHHWSRAKGQILSTYTLVTPQGKSIAPAYNGNGENAVMGIFAYPFATAENDDLKEAAAFADGAVLTAPEDALIQPFTENNVRFKETAEQDEADIKLRSPLLTGIGGNLGKYIVNGTKAISHIIRHQIKSRK